MNFFVRIFKNLSGNFLIRDCTIIGENEGGMRSPIYRSLCHIGATYP